MPTLLSVLALVSVVALASPSGTDGAVPDAAADLYERAPSDLGPEAGRLDLAALTADWADGP